MQKTAQESAQDSQPLRFLLPTHKDFCKTATQKVVFRYGIVYEAANGVDIQIDVLGIARKNADIKLFFIEAKKTRLTLPPARTAFPNCERVSRSFLFVR